MLENAIQTRVRNILVDMHTSLRSRFEVRCDKQTCGKHAVGSTGCVFVFRLRAIWAMR